MGGTPAEFVARYRGLRVALASGKPATVRVDRYRCASVNTWLDIKDELVGFFKARAAAGDEVDGGDGTLDVRGLRPPVSGFPYAAFMRAFVGKSPPEEVATVLRLVDFWRERSGAARERWASLQDFADQCLGLDCNGLVGAYFAAAYPTLDLDANTPIERYLSQGAARTAADQVRARDVVVYPECRHVAIVDAVTACRGDEVECALAQSRSPKLGGAQVGAATLVFRGGRVALADGDPLAAVVSVMPTRVGRRG